MDMKTDSTGVKFSPEEFDRMKEAAALPWTQWTRSKDDQHWSPPTNDQWVKAINPHLVSVRFAFESMFQSREQTIAALTELEKEGVFQRFIEGIEEAIDFFKANMMVLEAAEARFVVASSSIVLADLEGQA